VIAILSLTRWRQAPSITPVVIGKPSPRTETALELDGAVSIEGEMKAALRNRELDKAVRTLVMLGRDADAIRIAKAAVARAKSQEVDDASHIDVPFARSAMHVAHRTGQRDLFLDLCEAIAHAGDPSPIEIDLMWQAIRPMLHSTKRTAIVRTLRGHIRAASPVEDTSDLAASVARLLGADEARAMFDEVLPTLKREKDREALLAASRRYRSPG